jgi:hypothetical protein
VRNFSKQPRTVNLELLHEGNLVAVRPLKIAANGQQSQLFENTGLKQGLFSVRFDAEDDLERDNIAYSTLEPQRAIRVLLISEGNLFLERALNIDPNVELFRTTASAYSTAKTGGEYDVIVCDGAAPKVCLPAINCCSTLHRHGARHQRRNSAVTERGRLGSQTPRDALCAVERHSSGAGAGRATQAVGTSACRKPNARLSLWAANAADGAWCGAASTCAKAICRCAWPFPFSSPTRCNG